MKRTMKHLRQWRKVAIPFALMAMVLCVGPQAYAAAPASADVCTNFGERMHDIFGTSAGTPSIPGVPSVPSAGGGSTAPGHGILSEIYLFIKDIVDDATQKIFENFTKNDAYKKAVYAATILSVIIFGVFFTIGLVQLTAGQLLIRLIKIGIIFSVVGPAGWTFFSEYVVKFFNDGTDELVMGVINIAAGASTPPPAGATPFYQLDKLGEFLINPDTLIAMIGAFTTGPFGMGMGALMMMAFGSFMMMLIAALRSYAVCFVVRSLLLGLAPIFIVFLLFDRTKQLFNTWLNSLVSCSLQPILLFTFLAFFVVMMESATQNMFNAELCYVEYEALEGTTNRIAGFRFVDPDTGEIMLDGNTFRGNIACLMRGATPSGTPSIPSVPGVTPPAAAAGADCPEFPIKIIDIMTFLMLVFLASRFSEVIDRVANELSSTFIALDPAGKFDQFMSEMGRAGGAPQQAQPRPSNTGGTPAPSGGGAQRQPGAGSGT